MQGMKLWILDHLACAQPGCPGSLGVVPGGETTDGQLLNGVIACNECGAPYPVLAGVAIVVPDVPGWMSGYRESILATLVEHDLISPDALALVDEFASAAPDAEPLRFGDDWTDGEAGGEPITDRAAAPAMSEDLFGRFLEQSADNTPNMTLMTMAEPWTGEDTVLEVGCGAGLLTEKLAESSPRLIVADLSLRSVLNGLETSANPEGDVTGAVIDAEALPLQPETLKSVFAASVIDLLDSPDRFVEKAVSALIPGGKLNLSTPDPSLGHGDDETLINLLEQFDLEIATVEDGIPWIRAHTPRRFQVYFAVVVSAEKKQEMK